MTTRLDPTNPDHPHNLIRLGDEFAAAAERGLPAPSHAGWALRTAALVAVMAVVLVLGGTLNTPRAGAEVSVVVASGLVDVEIRDGATPDEVLAALSEAGVRAVVRGSPTGPSAVGRFVQLSSNTPHELVGCHTDPCHTRRIRFTHGATPEIAVGVPANGRPYEHFTDGFEPGEPFSALAHLRGEPYEHACEELVAFAEANDIELTMPTGPYTTVSAVLMTSARTATVDGS